ncbi:MAG: hypothetical protein KKA42_14740 [candidate division Zixibacteria bacterium]|nr:hypothetical protein [candidate division Zixibacteria bacterium]
MKRVFTVLLVAAALCLAPTLSYGEVWEYSIPDSVAGTALFVAMELDTSGNPHVAYFDGTDYSANYATRVNGVWSRSVIDSIGFTGTNPVITVDAAGSPHVAYTGDGYNIEYAVPTDTGWVHYIIDSSGFNTTSVSTGYQSGIGINGDGRLCVAYIKSVGNYDTLMFAVQNDTFWTHHALYPLRDCEYLRLIMDDAGNPVIGFHATAIADPYPDSMMVARGSDGGSGSWDIIPWVDTLSSHGWADVGFDLDGAGRPCYLLRQGADTSWSLQTYNGSTWIKEFVGRPDDVLYMPWPGGMSFDNSGDPWVMAGHTLSHRTGGVWTHVNLNYTGLLYHIRFDADNHVRVLTSGMGGMYYLRYWPGDPQLVLPEPSHNWNGNYDDWECPIQNAGTAPLILEEYEYASEDQAELVDTVFPIANAYWPWSIYPGVTDSLTIRFTPPDTGTFHDTLLIDNNDSTQLTVEIALQGSSTASADQGDLSVQVRNAYADMDMCNLVETAPLSGAQIGLYQGGVLRYGPVTTGGSGSASITAITVGMYELRAYSTFTQTGSAITDTVGYIQSLLIQTGFNNMSLVLPDSLVKQAHSWANKLDTLQEETTIFDQTPITYRYESAADVRALLRDKQGNVTPTVRRSLARLVLAEKLVEGMFASGQYIGGKVIYGISELVNFLFYSDTWFDSLWEILEFLWHIFVDKTAAMMDLMAMFAKVIIVNMLDGVVEQIASTLPCTDNGVICGKDIVLVAWRAVRDEYSSWGSVLSGFSTDSWETMKYMIKDIVEYAMIQGVFIDMQTNDDLDQAIEYAENNALNGDFDDACEDVHGMIVDERAYVETMGEHCNNLIYAAQMFQITSTMFGIVSAIPGFGVLSSIGTAMEVASYVEVGVAIGISGTTLFQIPPLMEDGVDNAFYPDGTPKRTGGTRDRYVRAPASPELTADILARLQVSTGTYDSTVGLIQDSITAGSIEGAALTVERLMAAETRLQSDLRVACAPVYSASRLAVDTTSAYHVNGFDTVYHEFMGDFEAAGKGRLMNLLAVGFAPVLESEPDKEDSLIDILAGSIVRNQTLVTKVEAVLDSVSDIPLPPIVVVSHAEQTDYALADPYDQDTVTIRIRNVGALAAENVRIVMSTNAALETSGSDTVTVGTLAVGEETDEYEWVVSVASRSYRRGTWTAKVVSSNAETMSYSGSYQTPAALTPSTGGRLDDDNVYAYPNPFNPDGGVVTMRYSLEKAADVTIKIYDAGGNLVRTVFDGRPQEAVTEQSVEWDGLNGDGTIVANGVYFFVIETSADERAVGKTAVLR